MAIGGLAYIFVGALTWWALKVRHWESGIGWFVWPSLAGWALAVWAYLGWSAREGLASTASVSAVAVLAAIAAWFAAENGEGPFLPWPSLVFVFASLLFGFFAPSAIVLVIRRLADRAAPTRGARSPP